VGNIGGSTAAKLALSRVTNIGTKGAIGEVGAIVKGLARGRIPVKLQVRTALPGGGFTRVDQVQRSTLTGRQTLVEAKFVTKGSPQLSVRQKQAQAQLSNYEVTTTTASGIVASGGYGGSAAGGAVGATLK
jgi:hypothetical protein